MNFEDITLKVIQELNQLDIHYMITGALAVVYYGEPRTTHDIDLIIEIKKSTINNLLQHFHQDFFIDEASIEAAIEEESVFNAVHKDTGVKVDFWMLTDSEYDKERFTRRVRRTVFNRDMFFPTPEDVIINKLEWFKKSEIDKHYFDASSIYRIQQEKLDMAYIEQWCRKKSIFKIWQKLQRER